MNIQNIKGFYCDHIFIQVGELQRLDSTYKEQVGLAIQSAEKLVSGKLGRQQYLDAEAATTAKCEDIYKKMETLRANL